MPAPKRYNGHHCWNCWNVALWIGNDEGLYLLALEHLDRAPNATDAAHAMIADLRSVGIVQTPDKAEYTFTAVRSAMAGLRDLGEC